MRSLADHKIIVSCAGEDTIWAIMASGREAVDHAYTVANNNPTWGVRVEFAFTVSAEPYVKVIQ